MVPLTLAVATDALLKQEFDAVRAVGSDHALWRREGLDVRAFQHTELEKWRSNRHGVRVRHERTGVEVYGAVDDVWQCNSTGRLHVVDYKSTSKQGQPSLDSGWGEQYKRQIEIYQWLLRQNGFEVHPIAFFLYVNASKIGTFFDEQLMGTMRFEATLLAHDGNDAWVDGVVNRAVACLASEEMPVSGEGCDACRYVADRAATDDRTEMER